jgi:DNA repair protein RecO (recombination protein O)
LVRGGQSPKRRALLQPGNLVAASWRGRLPEHLGTFEIELLRAHAAGLIDDPDKLAALAAAAALIAAALPEREPHGDVYQDFAALLAALDSADWPPRYVAWEAALLADLAYVSPRTGRAVSRSAGQPYHEKLLPLPGFLWREASAAGADVVSGMALTAHFLQHHLLEPQGRTLPEARTRLADRLRRIADAETAGIIGR